MRGRKPVPTSIRKLEGNRGKRKLPVEPEVMPISGSSIPRWFPVQSKEFYDRYASEIRRLSGAGESDEAALQALSLAWGIAMDAAERAVEGKLTSKNVNKQLRKHPALTVWRDNLQIWINLASRFGLTPADRARIFSEKKSDADPLSVLDGEYRPEQTMRPN